ncbi:16S rRNA (uracil(1498)-N(3))-methyltransferase [uncultured Hoeflea sp.]|uniref:16S rRNA (uracil(1498)-N(3))-methyltransferase n=1 Tax=uncultured Hoeflea sp. TaxID=538666 RepID=UPI002603D47D|nr:16S rRNA (uracil(1498)-N(3))-methyltransferase [uncultured Hoeflea sp.]
MRANFKLQRLYLDAPLVPAEPVTLGKDQAHYLINVLRMGDGAELLVFNGREGEFAATLRPTGKKRADLDIGAQTRAQPPRPRIDFVFAPLKIGRLDYLVQKATEMGVGRITPVFTDHTQLHKVNAARLGANILEAAEQCGNLAIPELGEARGLDALLQSWNPARRIIFCNESQAGDNPLPVLKTVKERDLALLVGPEGGFSDAERTLLTSLPFVTAIPLGPRILRADTAAVAALTAVQMTLGDW